MAPTTSPTQRIKITLKMAISRLRFTQTKETATAKQQRRAMADLLAQGKESSAKIRVENIIRQDIRVELLEYLELYCELLSARVGLLDQRDCDPGLVEAVKTIIYAAPYADIKELGTIRELLIHKFGTEFALAAKENTDGVVAAKIVDRCLVAAPSEELVVLYLTEIARAYAVPFTEAADSDDDEGESADGDDDEGDVAIEIRDGTGKPATAAAAAIVVKPAGKTLDNRNPAVRVPTGVAVRRESDAKPVEATPTDEFDALKKRFAALKKR